MKNSITFEYYLSRGKICSTETREWKELLTEAESKTFLWIKKMRKSPKDSKELHHIWERAYDAIKNNVLNELLIAKNEHVLECCYGKVLDCDTVNKLVKNRHPLVIKYFNLENYSEELLDKWDAKNELNLPREKNIYADFNAVDPFEEFYTLNVRFALHYSLIDHLHKKEAKNVLKELFLTAKGDYRQIREYISNASYEYSRTNRKASLLKLACKVAKGMGIKDFHHTRS